MGVLPGHEAKGPRLQGACCLLFSCCSQVRLSLEHLGPGLVLVSKDREVDIPIAHLQAAVHPDAGKTGPYTGNERKCLLIRPSSGRSKMLLARDRDEQV